MDWRRVKTILILALIVINGMLGWTLYRENIAQKPVEINRQMVIDLLNDKSVTVDEKILDVNHDVKNITLKVQSYDTEFVTSIFDKHDDYPDSRITAQPVSIPGGMELSFEAVENSLLDPTYLSDEAVLEQAYSLLDELKISRDDVYLKPIGHTGKKTIIEFGQIYNDMIIRDAYIVIKYNNENLLRFQRVWYDVVETGSIKRSFHSSEYALYKFISSLYNNNPNRERALEIVDFQLVYQSNKDDKNAFIIEAAANIFYEITTSDGETYLIDAIAK